MKNIKKNIPKEIGPYSYIYESKGIFMISGQIPISTKNKKIPKNISLQTKIVLKNIKNIIKYNNLKIKNIAKITIFITNIKNIKIINKIYKKFFKKYTKKFPARTCVEVSKLPKNSDIEIDAIAIK
ncbi:Rid family detoxifying hydrolase [Buchnera aphidicola (Ceratovacuna keduensis)]|uniref:Rid family detoxifying hydrolase n=1 Tax=Buchnera aphidicola TaxID=9 RepID=UPI0031B8184B